MQGEIRCRTVVKSDASKENSLVNMEYIQIGLLIQGGSP